jgi:hypothetical protein
VAHARKLNPRRTSGRWLVPLIASLTLAACGGGSDGPAASSAAAAVQALAQGVLLNLGADKDVLKIEVLSNRADLISGGDALIEISGASDPSQVRVRAGDLDVTSAFRRTSDGLRLRGLMSGLPVGNTVVTATPAKGKGSSITLTNHALTGPIFSGEQTQPWICETEAQGLGPSEPPYCMAPTVVEFFYRTILGTWAAYSPGSPPLDMAMTTTDEGKTVPFIVRQEMGTMNRGIYVFAVLWDPAKATPGWIAPGPWNGKVMFTFGGGANITHRQGTLSRIRPGLASTDNGPGNWPQILGRGLAVGSQSLGVGAANMNDVVSAETLMMLKERMAETLGPIRYSFGYGGSGGSINQNLITAAYPGLLDGTVKTAENMDWFTVGLETADCGLLQNYFNNVSPTMWLDVSQRTAVEGGSPTMCAAHVALLGRNFFDPKSCGKEWTYDPVTNPSGVRCTLQDDNVAAFGRRPPERWGPVEKQIGRGFAPRPLDNVGVQYGLEALLSGQISFEQFVDLNEKIGGYDIDHNLVAARMVADPEALMVAYRTGRLTLGANWSTIPMLEQGGQSNLEIHPEFRPYQVRARLQAANGTSASQVIQKRTAGGQTMEPLLDLEAQTSAQLLMDRWLAAIEADRSDLTLPQKVIANKPLDAVDQCFLGAVPITDAAVCATLYPITKPARTAAGAPLAGTVLKCQLRPLDRNDYVSVGAALTDAVWARLQRVFPGGVCDWSKPSVGYAANTPWMSFRGGPYGIAIGAAPVSVAR